MSLSEQKLRGGYYTPEPIAQFLIEWAFSGIDRPVKILEPSMGDGAFVLPAIKYMQKNGFKKSEIEESIYGSELFPSEFLKVKDGIDQLGLDSKKFNLHEGDFFEAAQDKHSTPFDIILGNPPFIRYQSFPSSQRDGAMKQLSAYGFKLNKMTNAWLFFLLKSLTLMAEKGKLAMVIPAELLQVKYAASAREFLSENFSSVTLFSFKKLVFEGVQQEVVLLMAEKDSTKKSKGIDLIEVNDVNELATYIHVVKDSQHLKPIDHITDKWTQYFLDKEEILLLRSLENNSKLVKLGEIASVDVGIVTGNNKFFVQSKSQVENTNTRSYSVPLVGRSASLRGISFTDEQWTELNNKDIPSHLLNVRIEDEVTTDLKKYIEYGESQKVNEGYKCRIRKKWYVVPSVRVSDAFMLRQVHGFPKIIINDAGAVCTDTIHRVAFFNHDDAKMIAASFMNSLSFAVSEVVGRSYGGGVLELEPNEAEEVLIPYNKNAKLSIDFDLVNALNLQGKTEEILDYVDEKTLVDYMGLSWSDVLKLRAIWRKLSNRRINRK